MVKFKVSFEDIVEAENKEDVLANLEKKLARQNKKIWFEMDIEEID